MMYKTFVCFQGTFAFNNLSAMKIVEELKIC